MPICSSFRLSTNSSSVSSHWVINALIVWLCRPPRPKPSKSHFNEVERYRWRECFNWSSIGTMHIVHSFLHDELFYLLRAHELFLECELHDKMHRRKISVGNYEIVPTWNMLHHKFSFSKILEHRSSETTS